MNLKDYRTIFLISSLVLMLIAASPTLGLIVSFPSGGERFSEFWILGPNHKAENYPFNVALNESRNIFVGVGNHLGVSSYYLVYVKFRNQTQPSPDATSSLPSPLEPLYEFRAFVADDDAWEASVLFKVLNASIRGDSISVNRMMINDQVLGINVSSMWDSEHDGFYFQLFFELWLYSVESQSFQFNGRFVNMWLNVTTA